MGGAGLDPETSTVAELEVAAERFEMAETLRKGEDKRAMKTDDQPTTSDKTGKRDHNRKDKNKRYRSRRERWSKWKKITVTRCPQMTKQSLVARNLPRGRKVEIHVSGEKGLLEPRRMSSVLRISVFIVNSPDILARDCPEKKTIPSIGSISLTTIDALHTTANALSLFSMSAVQQERRPLSRPATPGPNGQNATQSLLDSPNTDEFVADLITDPIQMPINPLLPMATLRFAKDLEWEINALPPRPETKYLEPGLQEPGHRNNKRYLARARRHGNSVALFDTYLRREINIDLDRYDLVSELAESLAEQQSSDFGNGNFVEATVWPVIKERITAALLDPANGFNVNGQTTDQWEVKRMRNPEIFAVVDNREIPDRRGDVQPNYIIRLSWLTWRDFNLVQHIWRCSITCDRIRASLYRATPNRADSLHHNPRVRPWDKNRFSISMVTPDQWWIQDAYLEQIFPLANYLAWNISFDIGRWFKFTASVKDYETQDAFDEVIGSYYSPAATEDCDFSDLWGSVNNSPAPAANVISTNHEPDPEEDREQDPDGKSWSLDDKDGPALPYRSPRPYALGDRGVLGDGLPDLIRLDDDLLSESSDKDPIDTSFWKFCNDNNSIHEPLADDPLAALSILGDEAVADIREYITSHHFLNSVMVSAIRPRASDKGKLMIDRTCRLERNAARVKEFERIVPHPIVIKVKVNENSARALVDSGSLSDFISTKLVDQLNIPTFALNKPTVQLATTGSRTVVNCSVEIEMA